MRTPTSDPWIIALSIRLYQWILYLGPAAYRNEYAQATLQVFRQCCHDAYQQRRTPGVLALWLPMFSEAIAGMLTERLSTHERTAPMLPTMRRSIIITFGSFGRQ